MEWSDCQYCVHVCVFVCQCMHFAAANIAPFQGHFKNKIVCVNKYKLHKQ